LTGSSGRKHLLDDLNPWRDGRAIERDHIDNGICRIVRLPAVMLKYVPRPEGSNSEVPRP